jgi:hypothetical protein
MILARSAALEAIFSISSFVAWIGTRALSRSLPFTWKTTSTSSSMRAAGS